MAFEKNDDPSNDNGDLQRVKTPLMEPEFPLDGEFGFSSDYLFSLDCNFHDNANFPNFPNVNSTVNDNSGIFNFSQQPINLNQNVLFIQDSSIIPNNQAYQTDIAAGQLNNSSVFNGDFTKSTSDVSSIVSTTTIQSSTTRKRKGKCMNPTAVAARENRAKKKDENDKNKKKMDELEAENAELKKKQAELFDCCSQLKTRNDYLENVLKNIPQILAMIEHMKAIPKLKINNVNLHEDSVKSTTRKIASSQKIASLEDSIPNQTFHNHNHQRAGICFHVKGTQDMSVHFCQICSNKTWPYRNDNLDNDS